MTVRSLTVISVWCTFELMDFLTACFLSHDGRAVSNSDRPPQGKHGLKAREDFSSNIEI